MTQETQARKRYTDDLSVNYRKGLQQVLVKWLDTYRFDKSITLKFYSLC